MYYGHGSWILLVPFGAMFVKRAVSPRRRRRGVYRGSQVSTSSFAGSDHQGPTGGPTAGSAGGVSTTFTGIAPGWLTDPSGRHDQRYWSGTDWTEHVVDDGVPGTDPPPQRSEERHVGK